MKEILVNIEKVDVPKIDEWEPEEEDKVFKYGNCIITAPICSVFSFDSEENYPQLNTFNMSYKDAYRKKVFLEKEIKYLNYFIKYYDKEKSLLSHYAVMKYMMDYKIDTYTLEDFKKHISELIMSPSMRIKVDLLNRDNYEPKDDSYSSNEKVLEYSDEHIKIMMSITIFMNICIPLIAHYYSKTAERYRDANEFTLNIYNVILSKYNVDIKSKLYETIIRSIDVSEKTNSIWKMQDIRGVSKLTQANSCLDQVLVNLFPKYIYSENPVKMNSVSIRQMIKFNVIHNKYEYDYREHKPIVGNGDEDAEDRFEESLSKQDQALLLQTAYNYTYVLNDLLLHSDPISDEELEFFIKELSDENGKFIINQVQKELLFLYYYRYFKDPDGIIGNRDDYVKLLILMKRSLLNISHMKVLPYILTGKIIKSFNKTTLKKTEKKKLQESRCYLFLKNKYEDEKVMARVDAIIATILTLKVNFIEFNDPEGIMHGKKIPIKPEIVVDEITQFLLMI